MSDDELLSWDEVERRKRNLPPGTRFKAKTGAIGTAIVERSEHNKRQAILTCTAAGCTETHIRESSDWQHSGRCRTHAKGRRRSTSSSKKKASSVDGSRDATDLRLTPAFEGTLWPNEACLAIGIDATWWGGSKNDRSSRMETLAFAERRDGKWGKLGLERVDLEPTFNRTAGPTEPNADPHAELLRGAIGRIIREHGSSIPVVISVDAPLMAVSRPELPPRRKSEEKKAPQSAEPRDPTVARRQCDHTCHAAASSAGELWNNIYIQPGAPLAPRIAALVNGLIADDFVLYSGGTAEPSRRLLIECFPNEVFWSAGALGNAFHPMGFDKARFYKAANKYSERWPARVLRCLIAIVLEACATVAGLDEQTASEWGNAFWDWLIADGHGVEEDGQVIRPGKAFDDPVDSILSLYAAVAAVNGCAHVHMGSDPADGHIIGPGLTELTPDP